MTSAAAREIGTDRLTMWFWLGISVIVLALIDQQFYRYTPVFRLGTTWRVLDVVVVLMLVAWSIRNATLTRGLGVRVSGERQFTVVLVILAIMFGVAALRGYLKVGTFALGLARYSLSELMFVPFVVATFSSGRRLAALWRIVAFAIPLIWLGHFAAGFDGLGDLLQGSEEARFTVAATAFGLACATVMIVPVVSDRESRSRTFGTIPTWLFLGLSLAMVVLVQHRSVYLATAGGMLVIVVLNLRQRGLASIRSMASTALILLGGLGLVGLIWGRSFFQVLIGERLGFLQGIQNDPTGFWRLRGWLFVIDRTLRHEPWIGFGFSEVGWRDLRGGEGVDVWEHNQYVHVFRAAGFIGLFVYVAALAAAVWFGWRVVKRLSPPLRPFGVGALAMLVMNIAYMMFYNQVTFLWLAVGILWACAKADAVDQGRN